MQNLSQSERNHLKSQYKRERDKRVCDRIKAAFAKGRELILRIVSMLIKMAKARSAQSESKNRAWARARAHTH